MVQCHRHVRCEKVGLRHDIAWQEKQEIDGMLRTLLRLLLGFLCEVLYPSNTMVHLSQPSDYRHQEPLWRIQHSLVDNRDDHPTHRPYLIHRHDLRDVCK